MSTSQELFIFSKTGHRLVAVEEWLSNEPHQLFALARHWFEAFRQCGDDVKEIIHDGCPTACIDEAAFGYVNVFKSHVNVGFYMGALLADPKKILEGSGRRMRHVKIRPDHNPNTEALAKLIADAYLDMKNRINDK